MEDQNAMNNKQEDLKTHKKIRSRKEKYKVKKCNFKIENKPYFRN